MGNSGYYKSWAIGALRGRWNTAILAGLAASFFGGTIAGGSINFELEIEDQTFDLGVLIVLLGVMLVWGITALIIGGAVKLGYAKFNLSLVSGEEVSVRDVFSQFMFLGEGFLLNLLTGIYIFLWSMLFIIPGIIKSYSYAMAPYIMHEFSFLTPNEAITESRKIMDGHKWELFLLDLSFFGWGLLAAIPAVIVSVIIGANMGMFLNSITGLSRLLLLMLLGNIGPIFILPYKEAAHAAFYRDITANRTTE